MNHVLKNVSNIPLEIPRGYYVVCTLNTQAAYKIKIHVKDENNNDLIAPMERQSMQALPPVYKDFTMNSSECKVFIDIPQSGNIDARMEQVDFKGADNSLKVRTYIIIAEDNGDKDYNDLFLTVTAYQKRS